MEHKNKSILDGVPVVTTPQEFSNVAKRPEVLEVVSSCPTCGCPVYGRRQIWQGHIPLVQRSCSCSPDAGKTLSETMQIK